MSKPSAIMGTFADVQSIRTRSVAVLKIEVPIEMMDEALLALGGWPQPGAEKAVAVALLRPASAEMAVRPQPGCALPAAANPPRGGGTSRADTDTIAQNAKPTKEPKALASLQAKERYASADEMSQARTRAVLLCEDAEFQRFMGTTDGLSAKLLLTQQIGMKSRGEIAKVPEAYQAFLEIEGQFRAWQQTSGHSPALTGVQP